ncbi:hypothetical protein CDIK_4339 [Cucumispora dikerogammari]|nr:hypothetical protein CDIK_4339 [Cucumispora dikerogammari]
MKIDEDIPFRTQYPLIYFRAFLKDSPLTARSWILWYIIPYLFIAARTEMFLLLAAGTDKYANSPLKLWPLLGLVTTAKLTSSKKMKFLSRLWFLTLYSRLHILF